MIPVVVPDTNVVVSGDRHLLSLGSHEQSLILPPGEFLRRFVDK